MKLYPRVSARDWLKYDHGYLRPCRPRDIGVRWTWDGKIELMLTSCVEEYEDWDREACYRWRTGPYTPLLTSKQLALLQEVMDLAGVNDKIDRWNAAEKEIHAAIRQPTPEFSWSRDVWRDGKWDKTLPKRALKSLTFQDVLQVPIRKLRHWR